MNKKILVIDRDPGVREVIAEILKEEGYVVTTLSTDEDVFEYILTFMPDAILLDVITPTDRGAELCEALKIAEHTKHIPLIVLSTHIKIPETIKDACADDVLSKPFDISELVNIVEKQLVA
jgi:two-component system phosphate regulon response regulator PhoB/two-component system alkaline phosphatase synthesis response regulator PhoP